MLTGLLQIRAVAGTVEGDLALLAATLRADAAVDRGAEALFLTGFADGAGQGELPLTIMALRQGETGASEGSAEFCRTCLAGAFAREKIVKRAIFVPFWTPLVRKTA